MEGLVVSDLAYVTRVEAGSSIVTMGEAWGSYTGGRSRVPGSRESY